MSKIEAVLRKVCGQAAAPCLALPAALYLYRAVATLARAYRTERADLGLPREFPPELHQMLTAVLGRACDQALETDVAPRTMAGLARAIGSLQTAVRLAGPVSAKAAPVVATSAPQTTAIEQPPQPPAKPATPLAIWAGAPREPFRPNATPQEKRAWFNACVADSARAGLPVQRKAA